MFDDVDFPSVGFVSSWSQSKTLEDTSIQTIELTSDEKDEQTFYSKNVELQTECSPLPETPVVNEDRLAAFLHRIYPQVLEELDKAERAKAFSSYQNADEDFVYSTKELYSISRPNDCGGGDKVNAVSWSSSGNVIAVGVGAPSHDSWCSHTSSLNLYNICRNKTNGLSLRHKMPISSCVTALSMHPFEPDVVAAGLFNGNVLVLNMQREIGASDFKNSVSHGESISQVAWMQRPTQQAPFLVTASLDSTLLVWKLNMHTCTLTPIECYVMGESQLPSAGVTGFSFHAREPDVFAVALEGGHLIRCNSRTAKPIPKVIHGLDVMDAVVSPLERHNGHIISLAFTPHSGTTLVTACSDQKIRFFDIEQSSPILTILSLSEVSGVAWSPSQSNIIFAWGSSAHVQVYDRTTGLSLAQLQPEENSQQPLHTHKVDFTVAAFNCKSLGLIALGDIKGRVLVWEVPAQYKEA